MKARNTNTGEVVTHFGISKEFGTISYVDSKGVLRICAPHDGEWEIFEEPISTLRVQSAIAAMLGFLTSQNCRTNWSADKMAYEAIRFADELIKQLNE